MLVAGIDNIHDGSRYRIKDKNKALIYDHICRRTGITRKEIVTETGIRPSTISEMVQQLISDGLVVEGGPKNDGVLGRPEVTLYPDHDHLCAISLYIVSRELKGVLVNTRGSFLGEASRSLPATTDNAGFLRTVRALIEFLSARKPEGSRTIGISITLPGYVDIATRTWNYAARWPRVRDVPLHTIELDTGMPLVANRALDAELMYLMVKNPEYATGGTLILHWGYGIGAAYAYEGKIIRSSIGSFCEIGHLVLDPENGRKCTCGAIGCLETTSALWALMPEFRRIDPEVPDDEIEFEAYVAGRGIESYSSVKTAVDSMGHALAILQTAFLPDRIIIYGPLMSNPAIFKALIKRAKGIGSRFAVERLNIEYTRTAFVGDIIGGTSELFQSSLRSYLTAW